MTQPPTRAEMSRALDHAVTEINAVTQGLTGCISQAGRTITFHAWLRATRGQR